MIRGKIIAHIFPMSFKRKKTGNKRTPKGREDGCRGDFRQQNCIKLFGGIGKINGKLKVPKAS